MKSIDSSCLYINSRIDIFCPLYNEYLWDIMSIIKNDNKHISDKLLKEFTLSYINEMIDKDIIYVGNKWSEDKSLIKWKYSKDEIIDKIDKMWNEDATFPDFLEMVWFGYQDWYINALKKMGLGQEKILWRDFIKNNIGNLEKWIEDNKPKE